jgi:hypothetical protein
MKHIRFFLLLGSWLVCTGPLFPTAHAAGSSNVAVFGNGPVTVRYDLTNGTADFCWNNVKIIGQAYASATLGAAQITSKGYSTHVPSTVSFSDTFGPGTKVEILSTGGPAAAMRQVFFLYDNTLFCETQVILEGTGLSGNRMAPLDVLNTGGVDIGGGADIRGLRVPWDNDGFVRYNAGTINRSDTSYEVAAFYDNTSRKGLIIGSVSHDTWKTGVSFTGNSGKLDRLSAFGGVASSMTRDKVPHGALGGNILRSPLVFIGYFIDWRDGLERFADANAAQAPRLAASGGVPFGWNSWGELATGLTYAKATGVSDFIKGSLQNTTFNNNGVVYINLDSFWDNLSDNELTQFVQHCRVNGQRAGIYYTPFANWGAPANMDACLKDMSGSAMMYDGAYSLDPTHPWTKQRIRDFLVRMKSKGFQYLKLDFTDNGAMEAPSHYDPTVTTGIQAYSQGMKYLDSCNGGAMFLNYSISPLFPYAHAHGRRVSCDSWGTIEDIKYTLNSISYGWWLSGRCYSYNDPDHLCLRWSDNEARSRITCAVIAGASMLLGDDLTNTTRQARARQFCTNRSINAVAKIGRPFRPIEGNTGDQPADGFVLADSGYVYIALFNFANVQATKSFQLARVGITSRTMLFDDLWMGTQITANSALTVTLAGYDCRLYKSAQQVVSAARPRFVSTQPPNASRENTGMYNVLGEKIPDSFRHGKTAPLPAAAGLYISKGKKNSVRFREGANRNASPQD